MKYIAFLRAINVGGHNVKMEELRRLFEDAGMKSVETFIASGNVIFDTAKRDRAKTESDIEKYLHESLGYEVHTFMRTPAEVAALAAFKPFKDAAARNLHVGFTREPLSAAQTATLMSCCTPTDDFHVTGANVYWSILGGFSDSKLSNGLLEKKLGTRATFRNINTVTKLAAKYA